MLISVLVLTASAGFAAFAGAALGSFEELLPDWLERDLRHGIIAFGGGALMAAVALVLVPRGMDLQPLWLGIGSFVLGSGLFMAADRYFKQHGSPVSQLMAMMLDFVPEAIALGALITGNYREAVFLTVIIGAQNMPEGFNAYREMTHESRGMTQKATLLLIAASAATGPLWGTLGLIFLAPDSILLGGVMTFCAGGILYLIFRDIAPQANIEQHWYPPFGAVIGFMVGVAGHELT